MLATMLPAPPNPSLPECEGSPALVCVKGEIKWAKNRPMSQHSEGWWQTAEGPSSCQPSLYPLSCPALPSQSSDIALSPANHSSATSASVRLTWLSSTKLPACVPHTHTLAKWASQRKQKNPCRVGTQLYYESCESVCVKAT